MEPQKPPHTPTGADRGENEDIDSWVAQTFSRLRSIADRQMQRESPGQTLSATSLVNEVFLKLKKSCDLQFNDEQHFIAIATQEMKRILIDIARRKKSLRAGGGWSKQPLDTRVLNAVDGSDDVVGDADADRLLDLMHAIEEFEKRFPQKAELLRLRYFLGKTEMEASQILGISRATASRYWQFARGWLIDYLEQSRAASDTADSGL